MIAVAKTGVAVITGSASMVAEAAHSWSDSGNEIFLLVAERRPDEPDPEVERVTLLHLEFVGPGKVLLIAAVGLTGDGSEASVAHRLRVVTDRVEQHECVERAFLILSVAEDETLPRA